MSEKFDVAELRGLLDALAEESIAPEQMRRLEQLVLAHPEAEASYVQYVVMMADLGRHFRGQRGTHSFPVASGGALAPRGLPVLTQPGSPKRWRTTALVAGGLAAAVALTTYGSVRRAAQAPRLA